MGNCKENVNGSSTYFYIALSKGILQLIASNLIACQ